MGLFDKKYCDICGNKIGLLGDRKLANDGHMCKDCAAKLSPNLSERRSLTADEIRAHLAYREDNRALYASFQETRVIGTNMQLHIDDNQGLLYFARRGTRPENPDIIRFDQIKGAGYEVKEYRHTETVAAPPPPPPGAPRPGMGYGAPRPGVPQHNMGRPAAPVHNAPRPGAPQHNMGRPAAPVHNAPRPGAPAPGRPAAMNNLGARAAAAAAAKTAHQPGAQPPRPGAPAHGGPRKPGGNNRGGGFGNR